MNLASIRHEYQKMVLDESSVKPTPSAQFEKWWQEAENSQIDEINAMALSTVSPDGKPSSRIVLLKGFDSNGLVFFTNYNSRKGTDLLSNKYVSLLIYWKEIQRQIRIDGYAEKISPEQSDLYFMSRPNESKISAWASEQSSVLPSREFLEERYSECKNEFRETPIARPEAWGGFVVVPQVVEFWQGRPKRLHDRLQYTIGGNGIWKITRLAP